MQHRSINLEGQIFLVWKWVVKREYADKMIYAKHTKEDLNRYLLLHTVFIQIVATVTINFSLA